MTGSSMSGLRQWLRASVLFIVYWAALPILVLVQALQPRPRRPILVWGPDPIISNKYWSSAMKQAGWDSRTLMVTYYPTINVRSDFDLYYDDLVAGLKPALLARVLAPLLAHLYITRHAAVMHIPFSGGPLSRTPLWRAEAYLYRLASVRTVVLPYGADAYMYSRISDLTVRQGLMLSYPAAGRNERAVAERVEYWTRHGDVIVVGYVSEGIGRWDIALSNKTCIDVSTWTAKPRHSDADGQRSPVRLLHAPNHRGAKGTEFLIAAVERLRSEGLQIELVLAERRQNAEVRAMMQESDVFADQFVLPGYGLAAIEAMASGLPVMTNLEIDTYARVFRRYSFLDECPILATSPETLLSNLRILVRNAALRRELGEAGRKFIEKYHSYETAQYLFGAIYRKLLDREDVDLMNLFHPLKSPYNRSKPMVAHPLVESRLPPNYISQC